MKICEQCGKITLSNIEKRVMLIVENNPGITHKELKFIIHKDTQDILLSLFKIGWLIRFDGRRKWGHGPYFIYFVSLLDKENL